MNELKEKIEALGRAFEDFKKINDDRLKEISTKGQASPLTEEKLAKANADIDRLTAEKDALVKRVDGIQTALNRSGSGEADNSSKDSEESKARKNAFLRFVRSGDHRLSAEEMKLLQVSNDLNGGYLVAPEIEAGIIRNLPKISVMRMLANVRSISSDAIEQRRRTAGVTASWVGEGGTKPAATNPTVGKLRIPAEQMEVTLSETAQILEDSAINVEQWLAEEAAEAFGNLEGDAFINGNGVAKPRGILTYAAGTGDGQVEQINSGSAAAIADADGGANGLIALTYALKAAYARNGQFILNRKTVGAIRKLKDLQKGYLWSPGLGTNPATILGYAYQEDDNMPVEGANNLIVAFGDFKKFYKIADRIGMSTIRDPFSSKPDVEFLFRRRVGGAVEIFEAAKILKCSA